MIIDHAPFTGPPTTDQLEALHEQWRSRPDDDPDLLVEQILEDLCQGMFAASWMDGIVNDAWDLLFEPARPGDVLPYTTAAEVNEQLLQLRHLTVDQGWWPMYDLDDTVWSPFVGRRIPVTEWSARQREGRRLADLPPQRKP